MAKKWSELKVGDKVVATKDGFDVTAGKEYTVDTLLDGGDIGFYDDASDHRIASEDWILAPKEDEKGADKMKKFTIGDKVKIVANTKPKHYLNVGAVVEVIGYDYAGDIEVESLDKSDWAEALTGRTTQRISPKDLELYVESSQLLEIDITPKKFDSTDVKRGQVRTDNEGYTVLVTAGFESYEDRTKFNTIILKSDDGELDFVINSPIRDQSAEEIAREFPYVVEAKLVGEVL